MSLHLHHTQSNKLLVVSSLGGTPEVRMRLKQIGCTPGTPVTIVDRDENHTTIRLRGKLLKLESGLAEAISIL